MKKEEKKVVVSKKEPTSRKKYVAESNKTIKKKASHESIFKKISKYFKGVVKEGKKVRWTNGKDLVKYSTAAVIFVIFFGIYFYAIDWIALLIRSLAK
ncbi:MAG: preprotein translocase subunit SecE [Erysipelotrichaceae bacterium]|nr:preprotein translocase subunit SecE [Erysipelotrichaceae bacterium]MDY3934177.1 preprotein translocase subunit SecE [Bacilli bacterium]